MKKYKSLFILLAVTFFVMSGAKAQEVRPRDWRRLHYLSESEMMEKSVQTTNFTQTPPPADPRMPGEFEPVEGVIVRYPLGVTYEVIAELSHDTKVYTLVNSESLIPNLKSQYAGNQVDTSNCIFVVANTNSYWVRDFGPWFIFNGTERAIVDFPYDRPRPNDNLVPQVLANYFGDELFGMNVVQTGGNMMQDGYGTAASTDLVLDENDNLADTVRRRMRDYLGIDNYHITIDPLGDYIKHIDCWGKFLAPDKILIAQVPSWDYRYNDYEAVADYFDTTLCSYGYPYKVYRVSVPGMSGPNSAETVAPFTNSLIVNNKVLVPLGPNQTYNNNALETYAEAMPGYTIVGFQNSGSSIAWLNTDALHCRTRGVVDKNMIYINHIPFHGTHFCSPDGLTFAASITDYSGMGLIADSTMLHYSINGGDYQTVALTVDSLWQTTIEPQDGDTIRYYISAASLSGHRISHPIMGSLDPHVFVATSDNVGLGERLCSKRLHAYPNPCRDILTIKTENAETINIYDLTGRHMMTAQASSDKTQVDVSGLSNGVYILRAETAAGTRYGKIVKR